MFFYHLLHCARGVRFLVLIALAIGASTASAATFTVTNTNDSGAGSLRQAIADAGVNQQADTIDFDAVVFSTPQTILLTSGELLILRDTTPPMGQGSNLTITGPGPALLTIDANNQSRIFRTENGMHTLFLTGLKLTRGFATSGGAILAPTFLNISNSIITENMAVAAPDMSGGFVGGTGGGISAAYLRIRDSIISDNTATGITIPSPPGYGDRGTPGAGGGIYLLASVQAEIVNCIFTRNKALGKSSPAANGFGGDGGWGSGGAVYAQNFGFTVVNSTFSNNTAAGGDGGSGGSGGNGGVAQGGAIYGSGSRVLNSTFVNNSTVGGTGAISTTHAFLSGNGGEASGGAIFDSGNAPIVNSTLVQNSVIAGNGRVGGNALGGGFRSIGSNQYNLANSTIAGNSATGGTGTELNGQGQGGGIYAISDNGPQFRNNVVAENSANTTGPDVFGQYMNAYNNLIGKGDGATGIAHGVNGNIVGSIDSPVNPMLGPIGHNGGPTQTRALLAGSPAIDAGNNSVSNPLTSQPLFFDQRGSQRISPTSGTIDIGAYEFGSSALPISTSIPDLQSTSDTGANNSDNITTSRTPAFDVSNAVPGATIELLRDGVVVSVTSTLSTPASLSDLNAPLDGIVQYTTRQTIGGVTSSPSSPLTVTFDNTPPTGVINQADSQADPTRVLPVVYTAVFSEPVTGFFGDNVMLNGSITNAFINTTNIGGGITWRVDVTSFTSNGGTVVASLRTGGYRDIAGNPGAASTSTDNTVTVDNARPTVTINQSSAQSDPTSSQPIAFVAAFNEPVSGFAPTDILFSGSTANTSQAVVNIAGGPNTYTVSVSNITSSGTVRVSIPANAVQDALGNLSFASTSTDNTVALNARKTSFDFDGDGKTDIGIFRPSVAEWWLNRSSTGVTTAGQFGASTDNITPADFTGDGKADIAFFRPSTGEWFVLRSEDFSYFAFPFGTNGDIPAPADYDADGKADAAIFRPSDSVWYVRRSSDGGTTIQQFGASGDVPVASDYDGDGKADIAIYRPSVGEWWLNRSSGGVVATVFGGPSDKPVQGDFTGDGKSDVAFWRPSTGDWYVLRSEDYSYFSFPFGTSGDIPAPGDYDGDGKFDATVFRPSAATWYSQRTTAGVLIQQFGATGDRPIPNAFVP